MAATSSPVRENSKSRELCHSFGLQLVSRRTAPFSRTQRRMMCKQLTPWAFAAARTAGMRWTGCLLQAPHALHDGSAAHRPGARNWPGCTLGAFADEVTCTAASAIVHPPRQSRTRATATAGRCRCRCKRRRGHINLQASSSGRTSPSRTTCSQPSCKMRKPLCASDSLRILLLILSGLRLTRAHCVQLLRNACVARRPSLLRLDSAIVQLLSKLKQCENFARRPKCSSRMSRPCNKGAKALRTSTRVVVPRGQNAIVHASVLQCRSISSARRTSPSAKSRLPTAPSAKRPMEGGSAGTAPARRRVDTA